MEDFYYAGGLRALMAEIRDLLDLDCRTVNGKTIGENLEGAAVVNRRSHSRARQTAQESGGTAVLYRTVSPPTAPSSRPSPSDRSFWQHTGPAVVFRGLSTTWRRASNSEELDVDENSVLVLQNAGPRAVPACPSGECFPIPKKLLQARHARHGAHLRCAHERHGVRHCVLHVAPESYVGGPLALVTKRRHDLARHPQSKARSAGIGRGNGQTASRLEAPRRER